MNKSNNITVSAIAALGNQRQIGKDGDLLWHIPEDLKHFKQLTENKAVVMGRKTWESLPKTARPLPQRENIILTSQTDYKASGAVVKNSLEAGLDYAREWSQENSQSEIFIIGGAAVYKQALPETEKLYLTLVDSDQDGDTFFPNYKEEFVELDREEHSQNIPGFVFINLERK